MAHEDRRDARYPRDPRCESQLHGGDAPKRVRPHLIAPDDLEVGMVVGFDSYLHVSVWVDHDAATPTVRQAESWLPEYNTGHPYLVSHVEYPFAILEKPGPGFILVDLRKRRLALLPTKYEELVWRRLKTGR